MNKKLIIVTAPSGSGKTTLVKILLERLKQLTFSVSACTRSPRDGETDGVDYYFLSQEEFQKKIKQDEFLEWEMVYPGKYYGTLNSELERIWSLEQFPLLDIDVQGALRVKKHFKGDTLSLFIKTPSLEVLEQRLRKRGTESEETIQVRLGKANEELQSAPEFDDIIINDILDVAADEIFQKVKAYIES